MKENLFTDEGKALVSKVSCDGDLRQNIGQAVAAIGGFHRLVEPGDAILVKPNFNTGDPPPGSSDPHFVKAVIELLYEHGAGKVVLGESSMFRLSTRDTMRQTGMLQAAEEVGAVTVFFDEHEWVEVETGGRYLRKVALAKAGLEAEKIVYVCCLKTHRFADFTLSLKLAVGFVRLRDRRGMHLRQLREKLADLNLVIAPGDRIAIDVEGLKVIQSYPGHSLKKSPWELTTIRRAVELGLGATSEAAYRVIAGARTTPI